MKKSVKIFCSVLGTLAAVMILAAGCSSLGGAADSGGSSGQGGSMARFTINGDYLYTVDNANLNVVSLADPARPIDIERAYIGWDNIETIFTMGDNLFIGSQAGMYIYDISSPEFPTQLSMTSHFRSCDPVVAYDTLAFVTLNSSLGTWCGQRGDVLQVYDISDMKFPALVTEVRLTSPRGLAVDGGQKIVFVCDNGVKAYDFTDPRNIRGMYTSTSVPEVRRINTYDCIAMNGTLLIIGSDGLYQLAYDRDKFTFISKIDLRVER